MADRICVTSLMPVKDTRRGGEVQGTRPCQTGRYSVAGGGRWCGRSPPQALGGREETWGRGRPDPGPVAFDVDEVGQGLAAGGKPASARMPRTSSSTPGSPKTA